MIVASLVIALGTLLGVSAPPPAAQNAPLRISSVVMSSKLVKTVQPKYPNEARKKDVQGVVTLDIIIGKTGKVESMKVTDGPKLLVKAAENAVKQWRYQPMLVKGKPIEVETSVAVGFKLLPPKKTAGKGKAKS
jgi:TonB family protein